MTDAESTPLRVAVVGSGIAGLATAYAFARAGHDVTIFERAPRLGVDSTSIEVSTAAGRRRIDTPPRAISSTFYPNLIALYRDAGIALEPWSWAWSYMVLGSARPFLRISGGASSGGGAKASGARARARGLKFESLPEVNDVYALVQLLRPSTLFMLLDAVRFHYHLRRDSAADCADITLGQYLRARDIGEPFARRLLLPILSMVCTCSYEAVLEYPVAVLRAYLTTLSSHSQHRARLGTDHTAARLSAGARRLELGCAVSAVLGAEPGAGGEAARPRVAYTPAGAAAERVEPFDHVVLATPADVSATLLARSRPAVASVLRRFRYESSEVLLHRHPCVMPPRREDWSVASVVLAPDLSRAMFTLHTNHADCLGVAPAADAAAAAGAAEAAAAAGGAVRAAAEAEAAQGGRGASADASAGADGAADEPELSELFMTWAPLTDSLPALRTGQSAAAAAAAAAAATARRGGEAEARGPDETATPSPESTPSPPPHAAVIKPVVFKRSVVGLDTRAAVAELAAAQGGGGIWMAGAYTSYAIPLQESACISAVRVARALGVRVPWAARTAAYAAEDLALRADEAQPPAETLLAPPGVHAGFTQAAAPTAAAAAGAAEAGCGGSEGGGVGPAARRRLACASALAALALAAAYAAPAPVLVPERLPSELRGPLALLRAALGALAGDADTAGRVASAAYFALAGACAARALGGVPWRLCAARAPATAVLLPVCCVLALCATWSRILFWFIELRGACARAAAAAGEADGGAARWAASSNSFVQAYAEVTLPPARWWWSAQLLNWVNVGSAALYLEYGRLRVPPSNQLAAVCGGFVIAISACYPVGLVEVAVRAREAPRALRAAAAEAEAAAARGGGGGGGAARVHALGCACVLLALCAAAMLPLTLALEGAEGGGAAARAAALLAPLGGARGAFTVCLAVLHSILAVPFVARALGAAAARGSAGGAERGGGAGERGGAAVPPRAQAALFGALACACAATHLANTAAVIWWQLPPAPQAASPMLPPPPRASHRPVAWLAAPARAWARVAARSGGAAGAVAGAPAPPAPPTGLVATLLQAFTAGGLCQQSISTDALLAGAWGAVYVSLRGGPLLGIAPYALAPVFSLGGVFAAQCAALALFDL